MRYVAKLTDDSKLFVLTGGNHAQSSRKSISSLLHVGMVAAIAFHHNEPNGAIWPQQKSYGRLV